LYVTVNYVSAYHMRMNL